MGGAASKKSHTQLSSEEQVRRPRSGSVHKAQTNKAIPAPAPTPAPTQKPTPDLPGPIVKKIQPIAPEPDRGNHPVTKQPIEKSAPPAIIVETKETNIQTKAPEFETRPMNEQKSVETKTPVLLVGQDTTSSDKKDAEVDKNQENQVQEAALAGIFSPKGKLRLATAIAQAKGLEEDRQIRIFISSTFADMQGDRNALFLHTFPLIRDLCLKRGITVTEVDLRWGITSEESENGKVIEICLNEISGSYLVCLLGDRYGWVPNRSNPREWSSSLVDSFPWLDQYESISVTEMEIRHGALNPQAVAKRSLFYFRTGAVASAQSLADSKKQDDLKNEISSRFSTKSYSQPILLSQIVFDDLKELIEKDFPESGPSDLSLVEKQAHNLFAQSRRIVFHGRRDALIRVETYLESVDTQMVPLVVHGKPGSGKSAFMAELQYRLSQIDSKDIIFAHYVGCTGESVYLHLLITRIINEFQRCAGIEKEVSDDPETIVSGFSQFLKSLPTLPRGTSRIMLMDAVNQLIDDNTRPYELSWMPKSLPMGTHVIISTTSDSAVLETARRFGWNELELMPLTVSDRELIIKDYFAIYSKRLSREQTQLLANAPPASNPLFLRAAMDELRIYGDFFKLSEKIRSLISSSSVSDLYQQILKRWAADFGVEVVRKSLGAIYASRYGLTRSEIMSFADVPRVTFLSFFSVLKNSLFSRKGRLDFFHQQLRFATNATYFENQQKLIEMHDTLASWMIQFYKVDLRSSSISEVEPIIHLELAYQLFEANRLEELASFLGILAVFESFSSGGRKFELLSYWRQLMNKNVDIVSVYESSLASMGDIKSWNFGVASKIGDLYLALDLYEPAEKVLEDIRMAKVEIHGNKNIQVTSTLDQLARLRYSQGRYEASEKLYREAMEIREEALGKDDLQIASSLNNLGLLHVEQGEFDAALNAYRRALDITEKALGAYHVEVGTILNNLATLYKAQGKYDLALECCKRDLKISEMKLGKDHIDVAIALNNLGAIYEAQGHYNDAEPAYLQSLSIKEKVVGKDNPDVAATLDNMGQLYTAQEKFEEAKRCYTRALSIRKSKLGETHPDVARTLGNLGNLMKAQGTFEEALKMHNECFKIMQKVHGDSHPDVATSLNNIASVHTAKGEFDDAISLYQKSLEMREKTLGSNHPDVAAVLTNIGALFYEQKKYNIAKPYFQRGFEIRERSLGLEHPLTIFTRDWLDEWPEERPASPIEFVNPMRKIQMMDATSTFQMSDTSTGTTRDAANKHLSALVHKHMASLDRETSDLDSSPRKISFQSHAPTQDPIYEDSFEEDTKEERSKGAPDLDSTTESEALPVVIENESDTPDDVTKQLETIEASLKAPFYLQIGAHAKEDTRPVDEPSDLIEEAKKLEIHDDVTTNTGINKRDAQPGVKSPTEEQRYEPAKNVSVVSPEVDIKADDIPHGRVNDVLDEAESVLYDDRPTNQEFPMNYAPTRVDENNRIQSLDNPTHQDAAKENARLDEKAVLSSISSSRQSSIAELSISRHERNEPKTSQPASFFVNIAYGKQTSFILPNVRQISPSSSPRPNEEELLDIETNSLGESTFDL